MIVTMADAPDPAPVAGDSGARTPLRVLAIDHHWSSVRGGVGTFNRQLCIALAKAGAVVECLVLEAEQCDLDEAQPEGVRLLSADPLPGRPEDERLILPPDTMIGLHPHLIIGHGRVTGPHALVFRDHFFTDAAYLHFVHTDPDELDWQRDPKEDPDGELAQKKWEKEVDLMRQADRVLAVGPQLHCVAQRNLDRFDDLHTAVRINPGFDTDGPPPKQSSKPSMQVLVMGRLGDVKIKGLDIAARAVAEAIRLLDKDGENVRMLLRGARAGEKRKLRDAVLGWAECPGMVVVPRTYTTDTKALQKDLRTSGLVLMPSRAEGFGLVGLEAITAGIPVLISARSGLAKLMKEVAPELVDDMVLGVDDVLGVDEVLARDGERWGQAIAAVLRDPAAAFARAADLRDRMRTAHSWSAAAERVLTVSVLTRRLKGTPGQPNHLSAFVCRTGIEGRKFESRLSRNAGELIDHVSPFTRVKPGEEHLTTAEAMDSVITSADVVLFVLTAESSRDTRANPCLPLLKLAQDRGKPIVVLRVSYAATPPIELPNSTTVEFAGTFASALGELATHLAWLSRVARRSEDIAPDVPASGDETGPEREFVAINDMPGIVSTEFQDRGPQMGALKDLLSRSGFRLIQLEGDNGIGKTALLQAVRDEQKGSASPMSLRAFVYFSARGYRWITVSSLLEDLVQAGDPKVAAALIGAIRTTPWREMLNKVMAALGQRRVAVVIDDADELFDTRDEWKDRELRELLTYLADRSDHEVKVIMSIKRAREGGPDEAALMRRAERVSLDRGLPLDFARSLLLDLDVEKRLADVSDAQLTRLLSRTGGHPRALELVTGMLHKHTDMKADTVSDLLEHVLEPAARLFAFLFEKLKLDERRVVQALAIFSRPVPPEAVTYLLKEVTPTLQTEVVLRSLRSCSLIYSYGDRYYLPSANSDFVLSTLLTAEDTGPSSALAQETLWLRGAEYFRSQREKAKQSPARVEELWPQFGEIELSHRARHWEHALHVMNDIDDSYLTRWGQSHVLASWRKDLRNKLGHPALEGLNLSHLVAARRQYEGHTDDLDDIMAALGHAESTDDEINAVVVSIQLANALVDRGHVAEAERYYQRTTRQARTYGLVTEQVYARAGRATCLIKFGDFAAAQNELSEAFRVAGTFDTTSERDELWTHLLVTRAWVARQRGDHWLDRRLLDIAHDLASQLGSGLLLGRVLGGLAANALATTQAQRAVELTFEAARIGVRLDNHRLLRESAVTRSLALLETGDLPEAAEAADVGARYAKRPSALGVLGVQGLVAYRQQDDAKARRSFDKAMDLLPAWEGNVDRGDRDYHLLNAKGVILCGLALLGYRPIEEAVNAFSQARQITSEPGALAYNDLILRQFGERADGEILARAHHTACGGRYGGPAALKQLRP